MSRPFPYRQVHLDFHTGPAIPDVGRDFDARTLTRRFKEARVNSVTVFAKCHHGHLYYRTGRPERHPGLKPDLDLLEEQVEALHAEGIRAPIYISVQCDEYAADTHPEWVARKPDSSIVMRRDPAKGWFAPGWQILDMSTPYQEYLAEQTAEVLDRFHPVDGIFFDMCWDQPSSTQDAIRGMRARGYDPEDDQHRRRYAREVAMAYMERFHQMVRASSPEATVYFNSRPLANLPAELPFLEQVEIEALPTGGWGYMFFPKNVRWARRFGKPYLGMTARFHRSWADFGGLKPYAALEYETSQMMAHGARCSVGDQLHPRGTLDEAAYDLIGRVFRRVEEREPYLEGAVPLAQIGVVRSADAWSANRDDPGSEEGVTRMLIQLKHQFDLIDGRVADLSPYELLVLPDSVAVDPALAARLQQYVDAGGRLLATGTSGLSPDGSEVFVPELGIQAEGTSPFTTTYFRAVPELSAELPAANHVMYERGVRVRPLPGTRAVAQVVEPYFERTWDHFSSHQQTPDDRVTDYAAATLNDQAAYVAYPVFTAYARHGNLPYRQLVRGLIDRLLPNPLLRVEGAPSSLEATVTRQPAEGRTVVHLLYYVPERRTPDLDIVEDILPLHNLELSLALDSAPHRAYLAPEDTPLDFNWRDGRAHVRVPEVRGHSMVVLE